MQYIYLDWNVIQYMKNSVEDCKRSIDGKQFEKLIEKLSYKKYAFPASEGHLRDLKVSYSPDNIYYKEDLEYLNKISNGYVLALTEDEKLELIQNQVDLTIFFQELIDEIDPKVDFTYSGETRIEIAMDQLSDDSLLKPFIAENNGVLDSSVMAAFLSHKYENIDNPDYYKRWRHEVSRIKKMFSSTKNSVIDQQSSYFKSLIPFLDFLLEDDIQKIEDNFKETILSFLNIDGKRNFDTMTLGEKIELAYSLLDYNPNFRDKINKKNKPTNMFRDIKNLFFASEAKYYITEDNMTYKKAKFVCKVLELPVKVLKMDEFMNRFN